MAQVGSRRAPTTEDHARFHVSPLWICGCTSNMASRLSPNTSVIPCQYHPQCSLLIFMCTLPVSGQTGELLQTVQKQCSFGNWRAFDRKYFQLAFYTQFRLLLPIHPKIPERPFCPATLTFHAEDKPNYSAGLQQIRTSKVLSFTEDNL